MIHDMIGNMGWEMGAAVRIGGRTPKGRSLAFWPWFARPPDRRAR